MSEILKGDASDAANRLGGENCPLFDDLCWAKDVKKAFDNGIGDKVKRVNTLLKEIPVLPDIGIPGEIIAETKDNRAILLGHVEGEEFYKHQTQIQQLISDIDFKISVNTCVFNKQQQEELEFEKKKLMGLFEWGMLGEEDKNRIGIELNGLKIEAKDNLAGMKKLINDQYVIHAELKRIEVEIKTLAAHENEEEEPDGEEPDDVVLKTVKLPRKISTSEDIRQVIRQLEEVCGELEKGTKINIIWQN